MDSDTAESFRSHLPARRGVRWSGEKVAVAVGLGAVLIGGVKVDVRLWSRPVNVKGTEVVAKRDSSMRRLIERNFQSQSVPRFLNRILSEFPVHV